MLTFEQARKIAVDLLSEDLIILDDLTIEKPYAWIFLYTSKRFYETNDYKYAIAGNGPIIINKQTGEKRSYSTAYNTDTIIEKYEEELGIWKLYLSDKTPDTKKIYSLKSKLNLSNDRVARIKTNACIESGSYARLVSLQADLSAIGIETKLEM